MPLVRRLAIAGEHRDRHPARRDGRGEGAVDRPGLLPGDAGEVEAHVGAVDLDDDLERDALGADAVVVHLALADIAPVGDLLEVAAHHPFAVVEHVLDRIGEGRGAVALDDPLQRRGPDPAPGDLGIEVARDHLRHAAVGEHDAEDVVDQFALPVDLYARIDRPLLVDVDGVGAIGVLAGDIEPVALDRGVADQRLFAEEDRHDDGDVLGVRAGAVGPVVEKDIAGIELGLAADAVHGLRRRRSSACP